ncbi:hypothetical protein CPB85DRAFT_344773 [Mucidula mucida]|nr:hypothetical protein CPB85DRAFT_344773 [Mucidula mucida]
MGERQSIRARCCHSNAVDNALDTIFYNFLPRVGDACRFLEVSGGIFSLRHHASCCFLGRTEEVSVATDVEMKRAALYAVHSTSQFIHAGVKSMQFLYGRLRGNLVSVHNYLVGIETRMMTPVDCTVLRTDCAMTLSTRIYNDRCMWWPEGCPGEDKSRRTPFRYLFANSRE